MPARGILIAIIFIINVPFCFIRPFYGVLAWVAVAILNPQWYAWSAADAMPWAELVAVPTLAGLLVFGLRGYRRLASSECVLLVLLWCWFTVTSFVSDHDIIFSHHAADTWYRWQFVSKILLMTVVTIVLVDTFERLRKVILVLALSFAVFIVKAVPFMILTGGAFRLYGPSHSMIADNNDFGLALDMTLPLYFFLSQTESNPWMKRLFAALFVVTIPSIFFTYSRGALLGLVAVLCFMFLELRPRQRLILVPVLLLAAIVAILLAPQSWKDRMDPTRAEAIDASALSRINSWTFSWRLVTDYPTFGGGFETFTPELFARYAPNPADVHGPHSIYFGVLAEHGFIGLILYLLLVLSSLLKLRRLRKRARLYGHDTIANYAGMLQLSLIGFLVSGTFLGRAYFDYFFTIIACIAALAHCSRTQWDELADDADDADEVGIGELSYGTPA